MSIKRNLLALLVFAGSSAVYAQNPSINEEHIPSGRMDQHEQFMADETPYPAKPRNMWSVGIHGGLLNVAGDVSARPFGGVGGISLGYGAYVRKALGYSTSLRLGYVGGTSYGQNWDRQSVGRNDALQALGYDNPGPTDLGDPYDAFVHNFQTKVHDISLDAIWNINNMKFHKGTNCVSPFLGVGGGLFLYKTSYDATDAGGAIYDFYNTVENVDFASRGDQRDAVEALMDGEFETLAEVDADKWTFGDAGDETSARLRASVSAGANFRLGKRVSLDVEHRIILPFDDLLDGQRWEFGGRTFTPNNDVLHYTSLGLSFQLGGKSDEPSWFVNPMDYVYNELKEIQPTDMTDTDGDGVIDLLDEEVETPEGYPVNSRGMTLDSDKDGCPDGEDPEPYSSPQFPIQDCQNVMGNLLTAEEIEQLIDNKLEPVLGGAGSNWFLPNIHFDLNSSRIKADAYDELAYVGEVMKKYEGLKVEVIGHADSRGSEAYNADLSRNRAEAAIKFLKDKYGIAEGRFILKYEGETAPLFDGANSESEFKVNRRVEFKPVAGN